MGEENNNLNNNVAVPQTNIGTTQQPAAEPTPVAPIQVVTPTPNVNAPQVSAPQTPEVQTPPVQIPVSPTPAPVNVGTVTQNVETPTSAPVQEQKNIKIYAEDLIVPGDDDKKSDGTNAEGIKDEDIKIDMGENRKVPVVVLALFFALLLVVVIYYYIVMTPEHVMDNAVNSLYDTMHSIIYNVRDENDLGLKAELQVDSGFEINQYINNLSLTGKVLAMFKEEKAIVSLNSEDNKTIDNYDAEVFYNDGLYLTNKEMEKTLNGKVMRSDNKLADEYGLENLDSAFEALRKVKDHIIAVSDNSFLDRKITTIDINGQTTIAIEALADLESTEFADFYYDVIDGLLTDEDAIKEFSKFSNKTVEDVVENFKWLKTREFTDESHIVIHLYMNLANTQLVSMELTLDDNYYIKVDNLNGYFYVVVKLVGQQNKPKDVKLEDYDEPGFYLKFEYDSNKGLLNGTGNSRIPGENELYAEYKYVRKSNEKDGTKLGNDLIIDFYNYYASDETKLREELKKEEEHLIAHVQGKLDIWRSDEELEREFGTINEKTGKYEIKFKGEKDLLENVTKEINRQAKEGTFKLEHYVNYCLRFLRYNKLDDNAYDKLILEKEIRKSGYTRSELESEKSRAIAKCDGNIAIPITGRLRISEIKDGSMNVDSLVFLDEDSAFKWACVYELEDYYDINFDDFKEVIKENELKKNDVQVTDIEVTPKELNLKVGETGDIAVSTHGEGDELTYKSKDKSIATIEDGKVTAKKAGTTEIIISTKKGISEKVKVTVSEN